MNLNKTIERAKAILLNPKGEWPVIAEEPATVGDIYKNYVLILAAIPAIFTILGSAMWGFMRVGVTSAIIGYVFALIGVYIIALIVNALADNFGAQKNMVQAVKLVAYAYTAAWVASIGTIVPVLSILILLAGAIYSIYLLYLGLPHTMKCPPEKATTYTVVVIVIGIVIGLVLGAVVSRVTMRSAFNSAGIGSPSVFESDSRLSKLEEYGQRMEEAGKRMEAAEKSGNQEEQAAALQQLMGAALGSDGKAALEPDRLKPFVPESLAGMKRSSLTAERNQAIGIQTSHASATYEDGTGRSVRLEITDTGTAKGLLALADWAGMQTETESEDGYEKTYKDNGRLVHERWNKAGSEGEYAVVLGERFTVKVDGTAASMDELKALLGEIDLRELESLKDEG